MDPKVTKTTGVVKKKKGVKKVKKKKDGTVGPDASAVKKKIVKKGAPKEEPFHVMSLGEIEDMFEKKN